MNRMLKQEIESQVEQDLYEKLTNGELLVRQKQDILQVIMMIKIAKSLERIATSLEAIEVSK